MEFFDKLTALHYAAAGFALMALSLFTPWLSLMGLGVKGTDWGGSWLLILLFFGVAVFLAVPNPYQKQSYVAHLLLGMGSFFAGVGLTLLIFVGSISSLANKVGRLMNAFGGGASEDFISLGAGPFLLLVGAGLVIYGAVRTFWPAKPRAMVSSSGSVGFPG